MTRLLFAVFLLALSSPALACSCRFDERTLEQRIDAAERVLLVRVVSAKLVGEVNADDPAGIHERYERERIEYRLEVDESLKGAARPTPRLVGLSGTGGGDCTDRLGVGRDLLLFVETNEREMNFSYCSRPFKRVFWPDVDPLVDSARKYIRDRTPIHRCDNMRRDPWDEDAECEARMEARFEEWAESLEWDG